MTPKTRMFDLTILREAMQQLETLRPELIRMLPLLQQANADIVRHWPELEARLPKETRGSEP